MRQRNVIAARGSTTMGIAHSLLISPDIHEHVSVSIERQSKSHSNNKYINKQPQQHDNYSLYIRQRNVVAATRSTTMIIAHNSYTL
jgi:hypothetical protein